MRELRQFIDAASVEQRTQFEQLIAVSSLSYSFNEQNSTWPEHTMRQTPRHNSTLMPDRTPRRSPRPDSVCGDVAHQSPSSARSAVAWRHGASIATYTPITCAHATSSTAGPPSLEERRRSPGGANSDRADLLQEAESDVRPLRERAPSMRLPLSVRKPYRG